MSGILSIVVLVLMGLTAAVLLSGIFMMAKGGEANQKFGNRMMTLRVTLQALTIVAFIAMVATKA